MPCPLLISRSREAQRVTNETFRWFSETRFQPSGTKVIATIWYTGSGSLAAAEGWEYPVTSVRDLREGLISTIEPGSGIRRVSCSLPRGWTSDNYNNIKIGPEQLLRNGDDSIIYSKNVKDLSVFRYSKGKFFHFRRICTTLRVNDLCFGVTRSSQGHICYIRAHSYLWHNKDFGGCISRRCRSSTHTCIYTLC